MAFDKEGNLYVAASLAGKRGIVRITKDKRAGLVVAGHNLVGLAIAVIGMNRSSSAFVASFTVATSSFRLAMTTTVPNAAPCAESSESWPTN